MGRRLLISLLVLLLAAGCGSRSHAAHVATTAQVRPVAAVSAPAERRAQTVTVHFGPGNQRAVARLPEPSGVILRYRLTVPAGVSVRASVQLLPYTVPLWISTQRPHPGGSCHQRGVLLRCTVGEEWCPMPKGVWQVRIAKRSGRAGDVTLRFHVGKPPAGSGA